MSAKFYPGLFKNRYEHLQGKLWILHVDPQDLRVFNEIGRKHAEYGKLGGKARVKSAKRDSRGRFVRINT